MYPLYADETLEDLQLNGLRMIQGKTLFRYGEDSVLLANFVTQVLVRSLNARHSVIDLGCNSGSISLLLSAKLPNSTITGVEITSHATDIFRRNIEINGLMNRMSILHHDWNQLKDLVNPGETGIVVSNPPYASWNPESKRAVTDIRIAREEIYSTVDQLMNTCAYLLKSGGRAFFIYRANRLTDVLTSMRKNRIEPRHLRMVQPFSDKAPTAFLVMGQKNGAPGGLVMEPSLVLFDKPSQYTQEVINLYGKYPPMPQDALYQDIEKIPHLWGMPGIESKDKIIKISEHEGENK